LSTTPTKSHVPLKNCTAPVGTTCSLIGGTNIQARLLCIPGNKEIICDYDCEGGDEFCKSDDEEDTVEKAKWDKMVSDS